MSRAIDDGTAPGVSRRGFLKTAGSVGAGLTLGPAVLGEEAKASGQEVNVALLGAGAQGLVLMEQALKVPGVRFRAVCDIWPYSQKYASGRLKAYKHEAAVYADYQDLLGKEKGLDAVIVATPDWMHAEHAIACMKAGLHVYCEKAMSNDIEKSREMVRVSRETKKLLQIGHQRRSNPRYLHGRERLLREAQLCGRVTHINAQWNRSTAASGPRGFPKNGPLDAETLKKYGYDTMERFRDWRWFKKFGGGPVEDIGSHQIDIFGWFLGDARPSRVMASGGRDSHPEFEWTDNVMAIYEFPTPQGVVRAFYQVLTTTSARGYFEAFMGTDGTLQISEDAGQCRAYPEAHLPAVEGRHAWEPWVKKGYLLRDAAPEVKGEAKGEAEAILSAYRSVPPPAYCLNVEVEPAVHLPHIQNFFAAVRGEAKLNCPGEVAFATNVTVLRANEAVAAGKPLTFAEDDFRA
jgi:predicted dehydrogenase